MNQCVVTDVNSLRKIEVGLILACSTEETDLTFLLKIFQVCRYKLNSDFFIGGVGYDTFSGLSRPT